MRDLNTAAIQSCTQTPNMRVSLLKDPLSRPSEILVQVEVSEADKLPTYSHSFKYKVPSGTDNRGKTFGEIIIYTDETTASGDTNGDSYSFDLEECRNKDCNKDKCPAKANQLLVANVFHTKPKGNALRDFGTAIFKALFSGYAGQLLKETKPTHPNGGIYLQLNDNEDLDAIPWEYANDRTTFLVHQRIFARVKAPPPKLLQDPLPMLPLRIVAVAPDPISTDLADLHLSEQFRSFIDGFTKNEKAVKLERVFPPTVRQMNTQLMKEHKTATVLHFMGHCGQKGIGGPRALIFEHNDNGRQEYIDTSRLVSTPDNLWLAFLSACDSRDVARILVERDVPYTIGSNCPIPNDLARKFELEFYNFLTGGCTVNKAMYQARVSLQNSDDIQYSYFAGAMVFYSSKIGEEDVAFQCEAGDPVIQFNEPPHNLTEPPTGSNLSEQEKEQLSKLYIQLRKMVYQGTQVPPVYTIKGVGGQKLAVAAIWRMAHLFPGGIFAWAFDKEKTSAKEYFQRLVEVIFPKGFWTQLTAQHGNNIQELGSAIIKEFGTSATCLLIIHHADILDLGEKERNVHAIELGTWLRRVASGRVKILVTSSASLDWCTGGMMDLNGSIVSDIYSGGHGPAYIHKYFAPVKEPSYFFNVPAENLAFVERSDILASMETALGACRILALRGLGGMGKTQLMLRYCYLYRASYNYVFWLEVESWSTAVESFRRLAIKLGIDNESTKGEDSEKVIERIQSWFHKHTNWLLLLNNGDDDETIKKLLDILPRIGGKIILTTRMHIPPRKATAVRVDKMQQEEAILLLYGMNLVDKKSTKFNNAQEIITELDCMPLAINLARAYIERTGTSFNGYLSKFKEQKKRVKLLEYIDKGESDLYQYTVATVWQLSFERIQDLNPVAVQVLEACAFFYPENIPACLFKKQYSVLELISSANEQDSGEDSEEFSDVIGEAIDVLTRFSLMTQSTREMGDNEEEDPTGDLLTIHRLVQRVIYDVMNDDQKLSWAHKVSAALDRETDSLERYSPRTQSTMNAYLSHILHFVRLLPELSQQPLISEDLWNLLVQVARYHIDYRIISGVEEFSQLSIRISERLYGLEHQNTALSLFCLASIYKMQDKYDEAEPLHQRALAIYEKALGPEHRNISYALENLAMNYLCQGKHDMAELLCQRALKIIEKTFGTEHPEAAMSWNRLAAIYISQGKYGEAEPLLKRALATRDKALLSENPDTAVLLHNLAIIYFFQCKYDEAEPLLKRALAIEEKLLGSEHRDTGMLLNDLAMLYASQGNYGEAEPLFKRALAIIEKAVGSEHRSTSFVLKGLAMNYQDQGKYSETELLYERDLAIKEKALGSEHRDIVESLNNLASLYHKLGKNDEAELLFKRALAICEKTLRSESTTVSLSNLAVKRGKCGEAEQLYKRTGLVTAITLNRLYKNQGKYDEAEPLYNRGLEVSEKKLGLERPDTARIRWDMAKFYHDRDKFDEAEPLYEPLYKRALEINGKALGSEHPDTAKILWDLASFYHDQDKYGEAEPLFKRALAIREKVLGSEHRDTIASLGSLAELYDNWSRFDEAKPLYQRALAISEKALGSEHPSTADALQYSAIFYNKWGKYDEAKPLFKRALTIREKVLGAEHQSTALILHYLGLLCSFQGKHDEAEPLYQRALAIYKTSGEHLEIVESMCNLAICYQKRNKYIEAESLYKQGLAISQKELGPEHPYTVQMDLNLAKLHVIWGLKKWVVIFAINVILWLVFKRWAIIFHTLSIIWFFS